MIPLANGILDTADETSDPDEALFDYDGVEIVFRDAPQMNNPVIAFDSARATFALTQYQEFV